MKTTARGSTVIESDNPLYVEGGNKPRTETHYYENDLVFETIPNKLVDGKPVKDIVFVTGKQAVANVVESVVLTLKGEVPLDKRLGIPYFESAFGAKNTEQASDWAAAMQEAIRNTNGVKSLKSFGYDIVRDGRHLSLAYVAEIETDDGEIVTVTNTKENR